MPVALETPPDNLLLKLQTQEHAQITFSMYLNLIFSILWFLLNICLNTYIYGRVPWTTMPCTVTSTYELEI